jgi:hypothetical protein
MSNKIFICRTTIAFNRGWCKQNFDEDKPVIAVEEDGEVKFKAHRIKINGPCEIIYDRASPVEYYDLELSTKKPSVVTCWIETESEVIQIK